MNYYRSMICDKKNVLIFLNKCIKYEQKVFKNINLTLVSTIKRFK